MLPRRPSQAPAPGHRCVLRPRAAQRRRAFATIALGVLALAGTGCHRRVVQAAPPVTNMPAPNPPARAARDISPPDIPLEFPNEFSTVASLFPPLPQPTPVRSRPAVTEAPAPEPAPPQISPRLSPQDQAEAERRTNEDIGATEQNLQATYGKQLNSVQHDLIEKIYGFLAQAREAVRAGDWVRARNLAQKARVLSVELANSL